MAFLDVSSESAKDLFEAATKVTSHFALGAFAIAAVVAIIWAVSSKNKAGKIAPMAWIVLIFAIGIPTAAEVIIATTTTPTGPYRITITVQYDGGVVSDPHVISSVGGQAKRTDGGIEFEISPTSLPGDRIIIFFADKDGLRGQKALQLSSHRSESVLITLGGGQLPPPVPSGQSAAIVYSNLSPDDKFSSEGWCVSGSSGQNCTSVAKRYIAAPFVPSATVNLSAVRLGITNISGTNGAIVYLLASGSGGMPGSELETWSVTNLPNNNNPNITSLPSKSKPILQNGQVYWLEAHGLSDDTMNLWHTNTHHVGGGLQNINQSGWTVLDGPGNPLGIRTLPAFDVAGVAIH